MPSIEQMHPLLHNGQSWMHTRDTKPPVPGKTYSPRPTAVKPGSARFRTDETSLPPSMSFKVMIVEVELKT
ncbi:hypothetical protein Hanom_Chr02g00170971 [Helianthus anomalus]